MLPDWRTCIFFALISVSFSSTEARAQTEYFTEGQVSSVGVFGQDYTIEDVEARAVGFEFAGAVAPDVFPELAVSLGLGQTTLSRESERDEIATTFSLSARYVANQALTASALTVEVEAGLGHVKVRSDGAFVGVLGARIALTTNPGEPVLVAPSIEGSAAIPFSGSDAEQASTLSPGVGIGVPLSRAVVVYARPNYTFAFSGEQSFGALGFVVGLALLQ